MEIYVFFSPATDKYRAVLKKNMASAPRAKSVRFVLKPIGESLAGRAGPLKNSLVVLDAKEFKKPAFRRSRNVVVLDGTSVRFEAATKSLFVPHPDRKNLSWWCDLFVIYAQYLSFQKRYHESEKAVAAFESNSEFSRSEMLEMRKTLDAQDKVLELSRQEKILYDREIKARDNLQSLSREELLQSHKVIHAWEEFYNLVREELLELRREFDAQQKAFALGQEELKNSDRTIKAMDAVTEMSRLEHLKEIDTIEHLTETEIESIINQNSLWEKLASSEKKDLVVFIKNLFRLLLRRKKS